MTGEPQATHECAWPGCGLEVRRDHLMCSPHWYKVPLHLRVELNLAWRTLHRMRNAARGFERNARLHGTRSAPALRQALETYRSAKQDVMRWIQRDRDLELRRRDPHQLERDR